MAVFWTRYSLTQQGENAVGTNWRIAKEDLIKDYKLRHDMLKQRARDVPPIRISVYGVCEREEAVK